MKKINRNRADCALKIGYLGSCKKVTLSLKVKPCLFSGVVSLVLTFELKCEMRSVTRSKNIL